MSTSNLKDAPSISMNINIRGVVKSVNIIDLSWYTQFKSYGDTIMSGIMWLFFIWSTYKKLPSIISGVSSVGERGV